MLEAEWRQALQGSGSTGAKEDESSTGRVWAAGFDMIYIFNCNWFDTQWQQYITHLNTNNTHNTEKGKLGSAGHALSLQVIPWHLPYNRGKARKNLS
jgi:hypothetical protein